MSEKDFIIVGQGLVGSILALTLEKFNKSFVVVDYVNDTSSSKVSAGILNPISFKRCINSWKANVLNPFSISFYREANVKLKSNDFISLDMVRIFSSYEEQNIWHSKTGDNRYNLFLNSDFDLPKSNIVFPYGGGKVNSCGRLIVKDFLSSCFNYLNKKKAIIRVKSIQKAIPKINGKYCVQNYKAKHIIYCEGLEMLNNPIFNYLPIIPNKGELLKIKCAELPNVLLSKGIFVLPNNSKNNFTIGATYDHKDKSKSPTRSAKIELLKKFNKIGDFNIKITDQTVGFRPTTVDRRPLIGEHPVLKKSYVINGMGSKGVMMAPWLVDNLIRHIIFNDALESEASIKRHEKKIKKENIDFASQLCVN